MIDVSILIPTIYGRKQCFNELISKLKGSNTWTEIKYKSNEGEWCLIECVELPVNIISLKDNRQLSIGRKRNLLMNMASGKYVAYHDDDDIPCDNYIELLLGASKSNCDCASLKGQYSIDGTVAGIFEHSIKYNEWKTTNNEIKFERFPNHLNLIRYSIAKQFKFPDKNFSEDFDWSKLVFESGLIKTEHYIPEIIYYYNYISNKKQNMSYSQSSEDLFIMEYFCDKPKGKFIDIGAYDVFRFSNTRLLYELGWSGVLVEPAPANYKGITDHYKDEERITVLNVAIGETTGEIDFYESHGDAVSTSEKEHMEKWGTAGVQFTKIKVPQLSVNTFMNLYCKDIDFISIDTEATNIVVFRNIESWVWEQIKMVCIEHDGYQKEIEDTLTPYGFQVLYTNAENIILAK